MSQLLKSATIIAPGSAYHKKKRDILINKGKIQKIAANIKESKANLIRSKNLHVSIGWFDIGCHHGEPGLEQRETLESLNMTAVKGGYTGLATFPNTNPVVQHKGDIKYIKESTRDMLVDFHPIAALSKDCDGKAMTEMLDLNAAGAVAFSDGLKPINNPGLLSRALEYKKSFSGKILHHAMDTSLNDKGQIHEGAMSISLGLAGISVISEKTMVERDINIADYTQSDIILHGITTKESVEEIKNAKKKKIGIVATVPYLNLVKLDTSLHEFNVNLKVLPPLRDASNQNSMLQAVKKNSVDAIISNHYPLEIEDKKKEFPYAAFGAAGLQSVFAALNTYCRKDLSLEKIIEKISVGPRRILSLPIPSIEEKMPANLVAFDPDIEWTFEISKNSSLSINNPFLGETLRGKVIACFNNGIAFISE